MKMHPYIMVKDYKGDEAINFYTKELGMELVSKMKFSDMKEAMKETKIPNMEAIMHSELKFKGQHFYLSDDIFPRTSEGSPKVEVNIMVDMDTAKEVDEFTNLILKNDGKVVLPLQDTFWGARYALVTDKIGVSWQIHHQRPVPKAK